ncbi:hypothetical protein, partial [Klebsiella pneumoniae]|uniref:hypothetical protein n=1 Tax=Klebsiella pneumoniae TaxID=573 RepID=UPI003F835744
KQMMACSFLIAELNQKSGSGLCAEGFNVSCGTSLPKSPDRIAAIKKPKALTSGLNFLLRND